VLEGANRIIDLCSADKLSQRQDSNNGQRSGVIGANSDAPESPYEG
jgi:hypothetical protein